MSDLPKVTFGIIVLNGEPFVRYNLRALYPFAHQIIIVEGAVEAAKGVASSDGHSLDNTLETLYRFKEDEDFDGKVQIITRDGFWPEKEEMSQAYTKEATGDYLWQVDIDEFYHPKQIKEVFSILHENPSISGGSFQQINFWGDFDYLVDGWYLRGEAGICPRLFRWDIGYQYISHRPPTVIDDKGRNLQDINWISGQELANRGIMFYHYSLIFPKQVQEKSNYYSIASWTIRAREDQKWAKEVFQELKNPFRVHNIYWYPSWLERFKGEHPYQITCLQNDIQQGKIDIQLRGKDDIEKLLNSWYYGAIRKGLQLLYPIFRILLLLWRNFRNKLSPKALIGLS